MLTFVVLAVYVVGVWMAFHQLQRWCGHEVDNKDEYQTLFILSTLSWGIYPLYGIVCLIRKFEEENA